MYFDDTLESVVIGVCVCVCTGMPRPTGAKGVSACQPRSSQ